MEEEERKIKLTDEMLEEKKIMLERTIFELESKELSLKQMREALENDLPNRMHKSQIVSLEQEIKRVNQNIEVFKKQIEAKEI
jgi:hypothetical protein